MPRVLKWRGFLFHFYSADGGEPPHIHVMKDGADCKIWLTSLKLAYNRGLSDRDLKAVHDKTGEMQDAFLEAWYDFFGK